MMIVRVHKALAVAKVGEPAPAVETMADHKLYVVRTLGQIEHENKSVLSPPGLTFRPSPGDAVVVSQRVLVFCPANKFRLPNHFGLVVT